MAASAAPCGMISFRWDAVSCILLHRLPDKQCTCLNMQEVAELAADGRFDSLVIESTGEMLR